MFITGVIAGGGVLLEIILRCFAPLIYGNMVGTTGFKPSIYWITYKNIAACGTENVFKTKTELWFWFYTGFLESRTDHNKSHSWASALKAASRSRRVYAECGAAVSASLGVVRVYIISAEPHTTQRCVMKAAVCHGSLVLINTVTTKRRDDEISSFMPRRGSSRYLWW